MDTLVSTDWLEQELGASDLKVIDATAFLPGSGRDARAEYEAAHVPGAAFVDLESVSDPESPFPHMLPPAHVFASRMQAIGASDGNRFVIYDNSVLHSAARMWWLLLTFGARQVALLDGGLQKWTAEGRPVEQGQGSVRRGHFTAIRDASRWIDKAQMLDAVASSSVEIVDARPAARFAGVEEEPRAGLASGHIPGSHNLPQSALFTSDSEWKKGAALRAAFDEAGVDLSRPMATTCGSGVTAAVLLFGAHLLGKEDVRLYDGSWSEWGADPGTPKSKGRS